ncbi:helix-turn-helix domain-containing protein [Pararhizobium haloflavum]|uniref:helix-turn-helix domain-containing protein n=1 Tax=Pararhizobium haloflavum TaxID=2037914 RepID=UPI000C18EBAD|nr:helix-turn-helix domain-containing protein [Pararhizobium haloflavum]
MAITVPTYDLYGDEAHRPQATPEFQLHFEPIFERSREHGWEIRPHRHRHYYQILHIIGGRAELTIGAGYRSLALPCLIRVPTGSIHGFRFSHDVDGYVLTIAAMRLSGLLGADAEPLLARDQADALALHPGGAVTEALGELSLEYRARRRGHERIVESLLMRALILSARLEDLWPAEQGGCRRDIQRMDRLAGLIEAHFRAHRPVAYYAEMLGMSQTHLTRILRQERGQTLQTILAERLVEEAKRDLIFGTQPVKEIALSLGFEDTAYFSRFFLRRTGLQPSRFRALHQDRQTERP